MNGEEKGKGRYDIIFSGISKTTPAISFDFDDLARFLLKKFIEKKFLKPDCGAAKAAPASDKIIEGMEATKRMQQTDIMLDIRSLYKSFPGVIAVNDVSFQVRRGEVHVLIGENGAGKSTLVKMLAGIYPIERGELLLEGEPYAPRTVVDAQRAGISIIHQELNMMANRTVAQNVFVGREPVRPPFGLVDKKAMNAECQRVLNSLNIDIQPTTLVKDLSIAQQQMVELTKALSMNNKVLIMDEPTSSLTSKEIRNLFRIVNQLRNSGVSIIYISHRLEEIMEIGDRVTVLRDGCFVGTREIASLQMQELITMMVGRKIEDVYKRTYQPAGEERLRTEKLTGLRFRNVSINLRAGEVVGLAGLVGAGRTEVAKSIFGYDPIEGGEIFINGKAMKRHGHTPVRAIAQKVAFLPENRKEEGLFLPLSIRENITQVVLPQRFKGGLLRKKTETEIAEEQIRALRIMTTSAEKLVIELSGGNQQKVVVAKWLLCDSNVIFFDEPTRGIDVGAKSEIYAIINSLAEKGTAVLIISSEMPELIGLSDRIYTMKDGEITGMLTRSEENGFEQEEIMRLIIEGRQAECEN